MYRSVFQLTTSHRGRRIFFGNCNISAHFNSLPHTEVDLEAALCAFPFLYFNSLPHTEVDEIVHYDLARLMYFNSLPHTEVDSNLSQNSERTSMNHITNRTINLYFFHFKHLITITRHKKAVFFWCESPRKIMCTLHSHYKINVPVTSNPGCAPMCSTLFL